MNSQKRCATIIISLVMIGHSSVAFAQLPSEMQIPVSTNQFVIGPRYIVIPEGLFVLVRKGRDIGAIRFSSISNVEPGGIGKSTYESYYQSDGSASFLSSTVIKHSGEIEIKRMIGFHPFAYQLGGQNKLRIGAWWFGCIAPNAMNMSSHFSQKDDGFEFAPTSARNVENINPFDKRLQWFRYSDSVGTKFLASDVPK